MKRECELNSQQSSPGLPKTECSGIE